ncbi:MAG TPA: arylamine N-acetyltransferase [Croceibacterium sp.]|nr:arylamine N-acetyltransferase [Croceibacterium sp.]
MSLTAYLKRLGLAEAPSADAAGLAVLQHAHRLAIPFENLDIPLGRGIRIDSASAFDKLVTRRRGGYCFEQNRVFADMLAAIGIANRPLLARVRLGMGLDDHPPRTHVLLLAEVDGSQWIADAGFGGSYVPPLPLRDGAEAATSDGAHHRVRRLGGGLTGEWLLERAGPRATTDGRGQSHEDWQPQYTFELAQVAPDDLEQANHWTATRLDTRFTTLHIASIALENGFAALTDRQLTVSRGGTSEARELGDKASWRAALVDTFALDLAASDIDALPLWRVAA